jgi:hypothetical protein
MKMGKQPNWGKQKTAFLPRWGFVWSDDSPQRQGSRAMMITEGSVSDKVESVVDAAQKLDEFVRAAVKEGKSLQEVETAALGFALEMGRRGVEMFIRGQGNGDLGPTVEAETGTLFRSEEPHDRTIRTVFGKHAFSAYVYAVDSKRKIELRPIDARMSLPEGSVSYLLEEFCQLFCVEQAFGKAQHAIEKVLRQKIPVDSLERINRRVAEQAEGFVESLAAPPSDEEGELLVATADGKGIPMIRPEPTAEPAFARSEYPGNRRMATLAGVYSVDRFERTAEDVVAALFREEKPSEAADRPRPCHKRVIGRLPHTYDDDGDPTVVSGTIEAFAWASQEVCRRRKKGQPLLLLCDGQESLWDAGKQCLDGENQKTINILDILHVATYVWLAARAFCGSRDADAKAFARERMLRILQGNVRGVIRGLRRMATERGLKGQPARDIRKVCGYFEKNTARMRYDEYLANGYPIASGVIEGACRNLAKDRMERSGMRWLEPGAQAMLHVRGLHVSDLWDDFQTKRMATDLERLHPHRNLIQNYVPCVLAA